MFPSWRQTLVVALVCSAGCGSQEGARATDKSSDAAQASAPLPVPQDIAGLVQLADALPQPVSIASFVAALPHPLALNATSSPLSLQPAVDAANPRIFIAMGKLILSVVPTGKDANLIEVGEMQDANQMIPAQLDFPVAKALSLGDVYTPILNTQGNGTVCAACHGGDGAMPVAPGVTAYATGQVMPAASSDVPVGQLSDLAAACDPQAEPQRCALLKALTGPTAPTQYRF